MGRATRWVRTLFGRGKKEERNTTVAPNDEATKRWNLGKSWRDKGDGLPATVVVEKEEVRRRDFYLENEKERRRHAIAVAIATTAAAQMALAAAQKAMAVVKLTSHRNCTMKAVDGGREWWAAVKIQSVFRGYLARKARRALKALVKLQALVRGHLFRKQMATDSESDNHTRRALGERRKENPTSVGSSGDCPQVTEIDSVKHKTSSSDEQQDGCFTLFTRHVPPPIKTSDHRNTLESNESILVKERRLSITQATPRLLSSIGHVSLATVLTPSPRSYMASTESFKAKVRSQAASRLMSGTRSRNSPVETIERRMSFNRNLMRSLSDVKDGRGFNCGSISS